MRDVLFLGALQVVNYLLPLLVMLYLVSPEVLGAAGYGQVGFAFSLVQYLAIVVDFGFNFSATKKIAQAGGDREAISRIYWHVMAAKLLLLAAALAVFGVLITAVPAYRHYAAVCLATLPMLLGLALTPVWFFQGYGKISLLCCITIAMRLAFYPWIFLRVGKGDVLLAAGIQSSAYLATALVAQGVVFGKRWVAHAACRWQNVRQELHESLPLFLSSVSTSVYTQLFIVILGLFCTDAVIGCYSTAERLMRAACYLVFVPVQQAFFPKVSALAVQSKTLARALFKKVCRLTLGVMLVCGVAIFALAPVVGEIFLGSGAGDFVCFLRIMSVAPVCVACGGIFGQLGLLALGDMAARRQFARVYYAAGVTALCLVLAFVPWLGGVGAATALVLSEAFVVVWMVVIFRRMPSAEN